VRIFRAMQLLSVLRRASLLASRPSLRHIQSRRMIGSVSAIDSSLFRSLFGTDEIREVSIAKKNVIMRTKSYVNQGL
jgi:hypothetical protein